MKKILMIGGSPCAGKSTVGEYLSRELGYQYIKLDDYMDRYMEAANEEEYPNLNRWKTTPWHLLFSEEVDKQVQGEMECYREQWNLVKRDIEKYSKSDYVIIEGCALMPELVSEDFKDNDIFYMVPEEKFQREKYAQRDWAFHILKDAENPQKAFDNWMLRDIEFAKIVKEQGEKLGYKVLETDGCRTIEETAQWAIEEFKLVKADTIPESFDTARLNISSTRKEETQFCISMWEDPLMGKYLSDPPADKAEEIYKKWSEDIEIFQGIYYFAARLKESGEFIGACSAVPNQDREQWDIGYSIHKDFWKQGYGTELVSGLIQFCRDKGAKKITADIAQENLGSNILIQKLGFIVEKEGSFKKSKTDIVYDNYTYVLEV